MTNKLDLGLENSLLIPCNEIAIDSKEIQSDKQLILLVQVPIIPSLQELQMDFQSELLSNKSTPFFWRSVGMQVDSQSHTIGESVSFLVEVEDNEGFTCSIPGNFWMCKGHLLTVFVPVFSFGLLEALQLMGCRTDDLLHAMQAL